MMSGRLDEMENSRLICNQLPTHHQPSPLSLEAKKKKDSSNYKTRRGGVAPPAAAAAAGGKQEEKTEQKEQQEETIEQKEQQEEKDPSHEQRRDNRFSDNEILNENNNKAAFSSSAAVYPNKKKTAAMIRHHHHQQQQQENPSSTRTVTTTTLKGDQPDGRGVPPLYGTRKKSTTLDTVTTSNHLSGRRQEEQQRVLFFSQQASRERSIDSAGSRHCHRRGTEEDRDEQETYHHVERTPSTASSIDSCLVGDDGSNVPLKQREVDSSSKRKSISTSRFLPPFLVPEKSFLISSMKQRQNKLAPSNKEHKLLRSPQDDDASSITRDNSLAKHYMTSTFSSFGGSSSHSICSSTKSFTSYSSSYSSSFGRFHRSEEKVAEDEKRNDDPSQQRQSHPPGECIVRKNRTGPSTSDKIYASRYARALQDVLVQENYPPRSRNKVEKDLIHTDIDRRGRPEKRHHSIHDRLARTKTKSMDLRLQMEMDAKKQKERERQGSRGRPAFYLVANSSSSNLNSNTPNQKSPSARTRSASPRKHFYTYLTETETISSAYRKGLATPQKKSPSTAGQKMSSRDMKALCRRLANQDTIASSKRIVPTPNRAPMLTTYEKMRQAEEEKKKRAKPKVGKDFFDILAVEKTQSMLYREIEFMKSGSFRE